MAFVLKTYAKPGDAVQDGRGVSPAAPGAVSSPQIPGQVPDRSSIRGKGQLPVPKVQGAIMRPLTELGTSQTIMHVYPEGASKPEDWELPAASYEEFRKYDPTLRTPQRPAAGYALADGTRVANAELAALTAAANAEVDPGE